MRRAFASRVKVAEAKAELERAREQDEMMETAAKAFNSLFKGGTNSMSLESDAPPEEQKPIYSGDADGIAAAADELKRMTPGEPNEVFASSRVILTEAWMCLPYRKPHSCKVVFPL